MTIKYMTLNKVSERGSWHNETHLTHEEALATRREQRIDYPGSVTRILKIENDVFSDITYAVTPEQIRDVLNLTLREETENAKS